MNSTLRVRDRSAYLTRSLTPSASKAQKSYRSGLINELSEEPSREYGVSTEHDNPPEKHGLLEALLNDLGRLGHVAVSAGRLPGSGRTPIAASNMHRCPFAVAILNLGMIFPMWRKLTSARCRVGRQPKGLVSPRPLTG